MVHYGTQAEKSREQYRLKNNHAGKAKQSSLPIPILITKLCRRSKAPTNARNDIEITPSAIIDIWKI